MESYDEQVLIKVKSQLNSWFLMSNIYPVLVLTFLYLLFVVIIGPKFMKHRKPMDLTNTLLAYNGTLVVFSVWWLFKMLTNLDALRYIGKSIFQPQLFIVDEILEKQIDELGYYYLMSKYVEFLDTVFFILRRKWNQVSFLHVYHHTNMAVASWIYLKYIWGRHIIPISIANSFVHAVMYSYYLLSALGPKIRPYLWWKKYITKIQLGQFVLLILHVVTLIYNKCAVQKSYAYFTIINTSSFLLLFLDFYRKAYRNTRPSRCKSEQVDVNSDTMTKQFKNGEIRNRNTDSVANKYQQLLISEFSNGHLGDGDYIKNSERKNNQCIINTKTSDFLSENNNLANENREIRNKTIGNGENNQRLQNDGFSNGHLGKRIVKNDAVTNGEVIIN